jgi:hypothetical protein
MIVYLTFEGSYSDREITGIFSTREKAEAHIRWQKAVADDWRANEIDDEPSEYTLDVPVPKITDIYVELFKELPDGEWNISFGGGSSMEFVERNGDYISVHTTVTFSYDRDVMRKSAIDRANMLVARELGI